MKTSYDREGMKISYKLRENSTQETPENVC